MNMIGHPSDAQYGTFESIAGSAQVPVHLFPQLAIFQKRSTLLRREDDMYEDLRE